MSTTIQPIPITPIWVPCPMCWGQRQIFENPNGEGYVPVQCPHCLGLGERATFAEQRA